MTIFSTRGTEPFESGKSIFEVTRRGGLGKEVIRGRPATRAIVSCVSIGTVADAGGLPTAAALVPEPKKISETIVPKAGHMDDDWCAEDRGKPALTRRSSPNCNCDICPNDQPPAFVHGMQTSPHIIHVDAKSSERLRFDIDVAEFDRCRPDGGDELVTLPSDSRIANRAFRIVPDGERGPGHDVIVQNPFTRGIDRRMAISLPD